MQFKPIIAYTGAVSLFSALENHIIHDISLDTCEWKRTHHRPVKKVRLEAKFQPLDENVLAKYQKGDWSIVEHPILHLFITDCNDVDNYKKTTHDQIEQWLKILNNYGITDWMILLVETIDVRKTKNLLQRTTVLDKIRVDFGSKNDDRCLSVLYPPKQKYSESFRCLIQRIRYFMLVSYNRNIAKYEELLRARRERRNHDDWDFRQYFFMQEDLAIVFEKFGLFTEALIQYDELDAIFSQFITHAGFGQKQTWLQYFKKPLTNFHGICLRRTAKQQQSLRHQLSKDTVSLLEFRNYLFEKQSHLLQKSNDIPGIAKRLINFLYTTLHEVELLKLDYQEGSLCCWEFVCALEVLQVCELAMKPQEVVCFQYCAPIWDLAKNRLYDLGKLCGLLPSCSATSAQLHTVVQLSAGVGDYPIEEKELLEMERQRRESSPGRRITKTPPEHLKEALSSIDAFQKLYLELAELAISTYKHISRLRFARLVGLDLGLFYCSLNEPHKAVGFFSDLLRELKAENWPILYSQTLLKLADCYRKMGDTLSYTKTCSAISCCIELDMVVRNYYFDVFLKSLKSLKATLTTENFVDNSNYMVLEDNFQIMAIEVLNKEPIMQDNWINVQLHLESLYPREVLIDELQLSSEHFTNEDNITSLGEFSPLTGLNKSKATSNTNVNRLKFNLQLSYKEDNSLDRAIVSCGAPKSKRAVRRVSSTKRKLSPSIQSDFSNYIDAKNFVLKPGMNVIDLKSKGNRVGQWTFRQLCLKMSTLKFFSDELPCTTAMFEVTTRPASAELHFKKLTAGIEQSISLHVSGGSFIFPTEAKIILKCSEGLKIRMPQEIRPNEEPSLEKVVVDDMNIFKSVLYVPLKDFKSFERRDIPLEVLTEMPNQKLCKNLEHHISLSCPWSRNDLPIRISFQTPIEVSHYLHTCGTQKFLQVIIKGISDHLYLSKAQLNCDVPGVSVIDLNPDNQQPIEIYKALTVVYLYEIQVEPLKAETELPTVRVNFTAKYANSERSSVMCDFGCTFDLVDYITLFRIQAQLEPNELCRLKSVCNLNLKITKIHNNCYDDLMYEVLTDQSHWAVCGRSSGIISMKVVVSHSISLDVMPLCTGFLPLPSIRLLKYTAGGKNKAELTSKVQPFPPGQLYNSTKGMQIHVIASASTD